jgi:hypothetical protein
LGKFFADEGVGCSQKVFQLALAEGVPVLEGYPVSAGEVRGGDDAFGFQEFMEAVRRGGEGEYGFGEAGAAGAVEVDEGEHLAPDGFIADPEDEVVAPLAGLDDVRKGEEVGADGFGVDLSVPPLYWFELKSSIRRI